MLTADVVFVAALAVMVGLNVYFAPRIKADRIAMQWSFDGKPTWHASKLVGMWGLLVAAVAIRLAIWAFQTYAPDNVHGAEVGLLFLSGVIVITHFITLRAASR